MSILSDLHAAIAAVAPINGVSSSISPPTAANQVTISFNGATVGQQSSANSVLSGFDFSTGAQTTRQTNDDQTAADTVLNTAAGIGILHRAVAAVMVDEINAIRDWITSFKSAVAAATSLADLQTRVAALAGMPDRTLAQAKTAVQAKIDAGIAS
jgi:hypothetical protein